MLIGGTPALFVAGAGMAVGLGAGIAVACWTRGEVGNKAAALLVVVGVGISIVAVGGSGVGEGCGVLDGTGVCVGTIVFVGTAVFVGCRVAVGSVAITTSASDVVVIGRLIEAVVGVSGSPSKLARKRIAVQLMHIEAATVVTTPTTTLPGVLKERNHRLRRFNLHLPFYGYETVE